IVVHMINGIRQATKLESNEAKGLKLEMVGDEHFPKSISDTKGVNKFAVVLENKLTTGNQSTKGLHVEFTDYAPFVFGAMRRELYQITDEEYLQSIKLEDENDWLSQCNFSEGKSGYVTSFLPLFLFHFFQIAQLQTMFFYLFIDWLAPPPPFLPLRAFFFLTPDSKYFIKSLRELHCIHIHGTKLYFVVMNNIFVPGYTPHERYDLKGSFVRRVTRHHTELGVECFFFVYLFNRMFEITHFHRKVDHLCLCKNNKK
ncbi:hypothetical protein RFI_28388, partial [Reticulomyxa filosa]